MCWLTVLPLLALILLFLLLHSGDRDKRSTILSAAIIWGVLLVAFTEILSWFRLITFSTVTTLWLLAIITLTVIYYRLLKAGKRTLPNFKIIKLTPVSWILLGGILFIVATVGLIAIVSPPNNWDSMTYHMARIVHWIQNRSVAHYPTYISAQLVHPPWAEFAIMHLQILSGGDRFANGVQWMSMVGCIMGVSLIAEQLGARKQGQIFASVFCATIPMGILQASSTQNDYVVAFWLVCLAHCVLSVLPYKKPPFTLVLGIAASLGLAIFTKSSGYIYALPFLIWLLLWYLKKLRWQLWRPTVIVLAIVVLINSGHYLRNLDLYGSPIATADYTAHYKIEVYSLPTWISNVLRNLSLHADIVRYLKLEQWITPLTGKVEKAILILHNWLGVNVNDIRTTFPPDSYRVPGISFDENIAGNPLHLLLIILAVILFIFNREFRQNRKLLSYVLVVIAGFFILCLMLKLQPYHSRHHLAWFVLLSPFVGLVFSKTFPRQIVNLIAILLLVTSLQFVLGNKFRPIAAEQNIFNQPREELYFTHRPHLIGPYREAIQFLQQRDCSIVGLSMGDTAAPDLLDPLDWEYPLWPLFNQGEQRKLQLEHIIHPDNPSSPKSQLPPHNNFQPCAIISIRSRDRKPVKSIVFKNITYYPRWSSPPVTILVDRQHD